MSEGETRYAHSDGFVNSIRFKGYIVSCGQDGDLRVWDKPSETDESPTSISLGSACGSVVAQGDRLFCAVEGGQIKSVEILSDESTLKDEHDISPVDFRKFESDCIHLASSDSIILACLADGTAVLCRDGSDDLKLVGHKSTILSGAINEEKSLAVTTSSDGTVRVWSTEDGSCVKRLEDVFTSIEGVENVAEVTKFHRVSFIDGNLMAVATERSVKTFSLTSYSLKNELEVDEIIDNDEAIFTMVTDGSRYIAISTNQGLVSVYGIEKMDQKWLHRSDDTVTSLVLPLPDGKNDIILFTDKGELRSMLNVPLNTAKSSDKDDGDLFDPDDEILAGTGIDRETKASSEDPEAIDLGAIRSAYMPTILGEGQEEAEEPGKVIIRETVKTVYRKAFEQEPFQIGEVPDGALDNEEDDGEEDDSNQERRFLVYNHVGFVVCSVSDTDASIDVDFHNSTDRHPFTLPNKNYTMAALDGHVLVLANRNEMMVYLLEPQSGEPNMWETEIKNDSILGVTAGPSFVVMATQNQLLRFFTPGGVQREVLALPGPLICLAGAAKFTLDGAETRPRENLLVFYNQGRGLDDQLSVACARYKVSVSGISAPRNNTLKVGLPHKTRLKWAGFTEEHRPAFMNSKGLLFVYSDRMAAWYPVFDSKEKLGRTGCCFVVSVGERYNRLFYIQCKKWCPRVKPLPVMVKEKLHVPLVEGSTDKSDLERRYLRLRNLDDRSEVETSMAKLALQMFALALKSERYSRAVDIIRMEAKNRETLKLLFEYTEASNKNNRYDSLLKIMKESLDEDIAEGDDEEDMEAIDETEVTVEPLRSQDLMPAAPVLAPKRIVLGYLGNEKSSSGAEFNPFKRNGGGAKAPKSGQLDDILTRKIVKPVSKPSEIPKLAPKQSKLTAMKTSSEAVRSPVQIFMEEILDELKSEKPDAGNDAWLRMAAERFRKMSPEQRSAYVDLSKEPVAKRQKISTE